MTATPTLSPASLSIPPVCPTVAIPPTKIADSTELVHDDVDHTGNLDKALSACPNATLACMWAMVERHTNCFFRSSRAPAPSHSSQGKGRAGAGGSCVSCGRPSPDSARRLRTPAGRRR
jgi:hypothetical protein